MFPLWVFCPMSINIHELFEISRSTGPGKQGRGAPIAPQHVQ